MGFLARHVARLLGLRLVPKPEPAIVQKPKPVGGKKTLFAWVWNGQVACARTKSEARAFFKAHFGLKRLPVGARVERVIQ